MEESESLGILLTSFAPLIQLWAGFCLLFFYETLFKHSPLSGLVEKLKDLHKSFRMQYIDFIPKDVLMDDSEFASDNWEEDLLPTIKNIAAITFFYSVFILTYIGVEQSYGIGRGYVEALQPISVIVLIYMLIAVSFNRCKLFHTYWTPACVMALLIFYYHAFRPINNFMVNHGICFGDASSYSAINVLTLFTLFAGLALVTLNIATRALSLSYRKNSMERLNSNCKALSVVLLKLKPLDSLPRPLLRKIQPELNKRFNDDMIDTSKALQECMEKEIKDEYSGLNTSWTQAYMLNFTMTVRNLLNKLFGEILGADDSEEQE